MPQSRSRSPSSAKSHPSRRTREGQTPSPPRAGLSPRRAETHSRVLDGALAAFLSQGYTGTTLIDVAKRAGVSTATLHKYYPTKRALFGGVIARFWETGEEATPPALPSDDVRAGLRAAGLSYAALLLRGTTAPLVRVIVAETIQHPELGEEFYERGKKPYLDRLEAYVRLQADSGRLTVRDPALAVRQFLGMINDIVFWPRLLIADLTVSQEQASLVVDEAIETFVARYAA